MTADHGDVARIAVVHGIGKQYSAPEQMVAVWLPALAGGLTLAGATGSPLLPDDLSAVFYGDLFRPPARTLGIGETPMYGSEDVTEEDAEILAAWWTGAAATDAGVTAPGARTLARTPDSVQVALRALSGSRFFAGLSTRMMVADLKQVSRYFSDAELRMRIRDRAVEVIGAGTEVVVAHSLGTVVAYEALCAMPDHRVRALVTLGSPLGIRNLIFDRLLPAPLDGRGAWPGTERLTWTNIADAGDAVALVKDLRPAFGPGVRGFVVQNGSRAHAVEPYLTARETGMAVAAGLREGAGD